MRGHQCQGRRERRLDLEKAFSGRRVAPSIHGWRWRGRAGGSSHRSPAEKLINVAGLTPRPSNSQQAPALPTAPVAVTASREQGRAFGAAVVNAPCSQAEGPPGRFIPTGLTVQPPRWGTGWGGWGAAGSEPHADHDSRPVCSGVPRDQPMELPRCKVLSVSFAAEK